MAIPEGYEKLAVIGIAYKGDYVEGAAYHRLNAVYYDGSTYVAIRDAPVGPPTADGANWQYLAKGFLEGVLSAVEAVDTSGVLGTAGARVDAQDLIDALADRVMVKLIAKSQIVNNLLATTPGNVLDAVQGKNLKDQINTLNLDLRATSILSRLTYNINYVTLECANKSGNQIHIAGFVSSKIDAGISMPADLAPKESFAVPCLNYDALGNKDYQCQIMAAVSSIGIMIAAASAPYTYTRFDIRFFI